MRRKKIDVSLKQLTKEELAEMIGKLIADIKSKHELLDNLLWLLLGKS